MLKFNVYKIPRNGIQVAGFSSDGDNRLLKSMRFNSKFDSPMINNNNEWFRNINENICFMQDVIHIGTKLRNQLLAPSVFLLIGNRIASISHFKILLNSVSKDEHGLVYSVICPDDRQNYDSLKKIMQPNIREALAKHVIDSEGTIEYMRICYEITSSLYEDDLPPLDRIFRIMRSTFFLRAWRLSITRSADDNLNISDSFITSNAYACIELNARNLIILTRKFRDENMSEYFIPTLFNSQTCEETFRKFRSMGTIN